MVAGFKSIVIQDIVHVFQVSKMKIKKIQRYFQTSALVASQNFLTWSTKNISWLIFKTSIIKELIMESQIGEVIFKMDGWSHKESETPCVRWKCTLLCGHTTCLCLSKGVCGLLMLCTIFVDTVISYWWDWPMRSSSMFLGFKLSKATKDLPLVTMYSLHNLEKGPFTNLYVLGQ